MAAPSLFQPTPLPSAASFFANSNPLQMFSQAPLTAAPPVLPRWSFGAPAGNPDAGNAWETTTLGQINSPSPFSPFTKPPELATSPYHWQTKVPEVKLPTTNWGTPAKLGTGQKKTAAKGGKGNLKTIPVGAYPLGPPNPWDAVNAMMGQFPQYQPLQLPQLPSIQPVDFYNSPAGLRALANEDKARQEIANSLGWLAKTTTAIANSALSPKAQKAMRDEAHKRTQAEVKQTVDAYRTEQKRLTSVGQQQSNMIQAAGRAGAQLQRSIGEDVAESYQKSGQILNAIAGGVAGQVGGGVQRDMDAIAATQLASGGPPAAGTVAGGLNLATSPANITQALGQLQGAIPAANLEAQGPMAQTRALQMGAAIQGGARQQGEDVNSAAGQQAAALFPQIQQAIAKGPGMESDYLNQLRQQAQSDATFRMQAASTVGNARVTAAQTAYSTAQSEISRGLEAAGQTNTWNQNAMQMNINAQQAARTLNLQEYGARTDAFSSQMKFLFDQADSISQGSSGVKGALTQNQINIAANRAQEIIKGAVGLKKEGDNKTWVMKTVNKSQKMVLNQDPIPIESAWRKLLTSAPMFMADPTRRALVLESIKHAYGVPTWTEANVSSGIGRIPGTNRIGPLPIDPHMTREGKLIRVKNLNGGVIEEYEHDDEWHSPEARIWDRQRNEWLTKKYKNPVWAGASSSGMVPYGGGGGGVPLATSSPGGSTQSAYIGQAAASKGLDPRAVLAVASTEGLSGGIGDGGHAFGPFQLNDAGGVITGKFPGWSKEQKQAWAWSPQGIDFALNQMATHARGLSGQAAINAIVSKFERPKNPGAEIAKANSIYGGGAVHTLPYNPAFPPTYNTLPYDPSHPFTAVPLMQSYYGQQQLPTYGKSTQGLDPSFFSKVQMAARSLGASGIEITSGARTRQNNTGAQNSNHLYGHAIDGYVTFPNGQKLPIGQALQGVAPQFGLRSGMTFLWNGKPDAVHVDDAYNQRY